MVPYLWTAYRTFVLKRPLRLSWRQLYHQFEADPSKAGGHDTVQYFRRKVLRELKKIKLAWPDLNYSTAPGGEQPTVGARGAGTGPRRFAPATVAKPMRVV